MNKQKEFCDKFRCDLSPGKRYYKRLPMTYVDYINANPMGASIVDMQTYEEEGIKLEMASSDFIRLMDAAMEGMEHRLFRQQNPAASELYSQYIMMRELTRRYMP